MDCRLKIRNQFIFNNLSSLFTLFQTTFRLKMTLFLTSLELWVALLPLFHPFRYPLHQILLHPTNEGKENQKQACVDDQGQNSILDMDALLHKKQGDCKGKIKESRPQIIRYRGLLLPNEIRQHHAGAITREAAPCASHVTVLWHEDEVGGFFS